MPPSFTHGWRFGWDEAPTQLARVVAVVVVLLVLTRMLLIKLVMLVRMLAFQVAVQPTMLASRQPLLMGLLVQLV